MEQSEESKEQRKSPASQEKEEESFDLISHEEAEGAEAIKEKIREEEA